MKTLTTPVAVVNNINNITKWKVLQFVNHDDLTPPYGEVIIQVQAPGAKIYPHAGATYQLIAVDNGNSTCLAINGTSIRTDDQLITVRRQLAGTPYSTIAEADNSGTQTARRLAVETACLATGLVDAALAGA